MSDRALHLLPPEESARRFREQIVPQRLAHGIPQDRPVLVIVAGQPGAGKSVVEDRIRADLGGGTVTIDADDMRTHHPDYVPLALRNDRLAAPATHPDAARWVEMAKDHCISQRYNVVLSTTLRTPEGAQATIAKFRQAGYRVEVAALAVHEGASRLGVLRRYQRGREDAGFGRYVPAAFQRDAYPGLLAALDRIDTDRLADAVRVYRRDGRRLYANQLDERGQWAHPPGARAAVETGRALPWTREEIAAFRDQAEYLRDRLPEDLQADLLTAARAARNHIAAAGTAASPAEVARAARLAGTRVTGAAHPARPTTAEQQDPRRDPGRAARFDQSR